MLTSVDFNNINKLNHLLTTDLNTNSRLYVKGDVIYKIPEFFDKELENTLIYLEKKDFPELIKILGFIEDNGKKIGYYFKKEDAKSLHKHRHRKVELKTRDCCKMIKMFEKLNDNNVIYYDFHTGNVLENNKTGELKLCDLDGIRLSTDPELKKNQMIRAIILCVSYIYNVYYEEAGVAVRHSNLRLDENGIFRDCLDSIGKDDFESKVENIKNINRGTLRRERSLIKESFNDRLISGYYKEL